MEGINNKPILLHCVLFFVFLIVIETQCEINHVSSFSIDLSESSVVDHLSHSSRVRRDTEETKSEKKDSKCEKQKEKFADLSKKIESGKRLEETYKFANETKFNLALAWAGSNDNGHLIVLTSETHFLAKPESTLWRSTNHGRDWDDISAKVNNDKFRKDDGLQRNPHNPRKVYLIGYEHFLYTTEDGGEAWHKQELVKGEEEQKRFSVEEVLEFHSLEDYEDYVAVISNDRTLYVTYDNFQTSVSPAKRNVHSAKWGTHKGFEKSIYVTTGERRDPFIATGPETLTLERRDSADGGWKTLMTGVVLFNVQGKFVYASKFKSDKPTSAQDDRLMMISTDGGDTWKEARLPTLTKDRFYSVLDMSEDLIFMHVDNPGDTGHGTLYTSSSNGLVYSESLKNHLFPNYNSVHDFYKVKSMRGVYLASQMGEEQSIHTVITYNRGGEWKQVAKPVDVECEHGKPGEKCFLQIHNAYSVHRGIKARLPQSIDKAYGLLLVHAHVATNLQTSSPDVYLSNDGGYTFKKVLEGPHAYEIADSGGLIVAVSLDTPTPDTIKFSTDEGQCWHNYKYTNEKLRFTGLLTEPGGQSMTISIWGYTLDTKKWTVNTIDFNQVVKDECKDSDYVNWTPHTSLHQGSEQEGCLLGQRETFARIKHDSWCRNGYNKHMVHIKEYCLCTREDYECDYGFYRPVGSDQCVRQQDIHADDIEICNGKQMEQLVTLGYRLVPGDKCDLKNQDAFHPTQSKEITFEGVCKAGDKSDIKHDTVADAKTGSGKMVVIAIVAGVVVVLAVVAGFMIYKMVLLRRHKVVYRYSLMNQGGTDGREDEFENALIDHDALYNDASDDEVEAENKSPDHLPARRGLGAGGSSRDAERGYHDDSDDDMLG